MQPLKTSTKNFEISKNDCSNFSANKFISIKLWSFLAATFNFPTLVIKCFQFFLTAWLFSCGLYNDLVVYTAKLS